MLSRFWIMHLIFNDFERRSKFLLLFFAKIYDFNFYKLFLRRGLRFVTYIYKKCFYYRHAFANDLLLGVKSSYRIYKPFNRTPFEKKKMFFKLSFK